MDTRVQEHFAESQASDNFNIISTPAPKWTALTFVLYITSTTDVSNQGSWAAMTWATQQFWEAIAEKLKHFRHLSAMTIYITEDSCWALTAWELALSQSRIDDAATGVSKLVEHSINKFQVINVAWACYRLKTGFQDSHKVFHGDDNLDFLQELEQDAFIPADAETYNTTRTKDRIWNPIYSGCSVICRWQPAIRVTEAHGYYAYEGSTQVRPSWGRRDTSFVTLLIHVWLSFNVFICTNQVSSARNTYLGPNHSKYRRRCWSWTTPTRRLAVMSA